MSGSLSAAHPPREKEEKGSHCFETLKAIDRFLLYLLNLMYFAYSRLFISFSFLPVLEFIISVRVC